MAKKILLILLCAIGAAILGCTRHPTTGPALEYEIVKSRWDSLPALEVHISFVPQGREHARILYQEVAWGQEGLYDCLKDIRLVRGSGELTVVRDSGWVDIHYTQRPDTLEVAYTVIQDRPGDGPQTPVYRPIIQEEYFQVFSHNLFMVPEGLDNSGTDSTRIRLSWKGWGPGEVIHNSFGNGKRKQDLGVLPVRSFHNAIFAGGDFRIYSDSIQGNSLVMAIRGTHDQTEEGEVFRLLRSTVEVQRNFWSDHSQPYFTVLLRTFPLSEGSSFQGTGLTQSFAASVSHNMGLDTEGLAYLFNHELLHNWIGNGIENEREEAQYWFSEGFTEYYTLKNIARHDLAGLGADYALGYLNEAIRLLEASPVRNAPNQAITYENFWKDRNWQKLPYRRGLLFAFVLDQKLRRESNGAKSLDDVMRNLLEAARQHGTRLGHDHFVQTVNGCLGTDIRPFFKAYIEDGNPLPLEELLTEYGFDFTRGADLFELGFSYETEQWMVTDVDSGSAAFKAGVRAGDRMAGRSIHFGDTEKQVALVLEREGRRIAVRYLPVRKSDVVQLSYSDHNKGLFSR